MSSPIRSLRLTFRYDEAGIRLVDRTPRRSRAVPTEPLDREAPPRAIILELRSMQEEVSYRRFLTDPIPQSLEVGADDGKLQRVEYVRPTGGFSVVVPVPKRETIVVVSAGPTVTFKQAGLADLGLSGQRRELVRATLEGIGDGNE